MQIFYTINPHINNLSMQRLTDDFFYILKKYYRKTLGQRYYKHTNKQFLIGIFQEVGQREIKEPHLHMIIEIPMKSVNSFRHFLLNNLKQIYPYLTDKLIAVEGNPTKLWNYCLKENLEIITNKDYIKRTY